MLNSGLEDGRESYSCKCIEENYRKIKVKKTMTKVRELEYVEKPDLHSVLI